MVGGHESNPEKSTALSVQSFACADNNWMRCLASSSKLETMFGSIDFLAEDEIRPSVAASLPRRRGVGHVKNAREVFLAFSYPYCDDTLIMSL
jgi:hypothetical protein